MSDTSRMDECIVVYPKENAHDMYVWAESARKLERENAALRAEKERVMELIRLWETQWPTYPNTTEGAYGAAAVRCCIRELRAALEAARKEQP